MPNHYVGDLLRTMAISGRSRARTELFDLTVVPTLAPHPVQTHRQLCRWARSARAVSVSSDRLHTTAIPMAAATAVLVLQWEVIQEGRRIRRFIIRRLWTQLCSVLSQYPYRLAARRSQKCYAFGDLQTELYSKSNALRQVPAMPVSHCSCSDFPPDQLFRD